MQQDDDKEEKVINLEFATHILAMAQLLNFTNGDVITHFIHIMACLIPADLDEESLRDLIRLCHNQIRRVLDDRKKHESMQDM
jgi:hypothetical protein